MYLGISAAVGFKNIYISEEVKNKKSGVRVKQAEELRQSFLLVRKLVSLSS